MKETLRRLIEEQAGIPASVIRDDSTIEGDLAMDSLSFISLQVAVEEVFDITCDPADIEARNRFDAIAAFIREQTGARNGAAPQPPAGGARQGASGRRARGRPRSKS
ncbi:MAG: acyl carrier protein [Candidatus Binatia bacterium]